MATQEKLLKSLETLKNLSSLNQTEAGSKKRERIHHCNVITEAISNPTIKIASNFGQLLGFAIEVLLQLCDDPEADVRMIADESLNRVIRATSTNNVSKIEIELHREIKKNGAARCLRAALWRFANLAHYIRPVKGKPYVVNLLPCLVSVAERSEEQIHETLANSLPKIMSALGCFMTDNDVKTLLKAFFANISHSSPVIRRSSAACILTTCLNCRKPYVFITYTLNNVTDLLVPVQDTQISALILGALGCLKSILPHINNTEKDQEIQGSFGVRKELNEIPSAAEKLLQVYELCLHYMTHADHNVVNAGLETLNILLQNASPQFKACLLNLNGITRSRITYFDNPMKYKIRSPSVLSVATTLTGDDSLESELTDSIRPDIEKWINESKLSVGNVTFAKTRDLLKPDSSEDLCYSDISIGPVCNSSKESLISETSSEKSGSQDNDLKTSASMDIAGNEVDIGDFKDKSIPLLYCARFISKNFLLSGNPSVMISDKTVRVSVKSLALSCLSTIFQLYPLAFLMYLDKNASRMSEDSQPLSDLLLYENHSDPQLRGAVRIMAAAFLKAAILESGGQYCSYIERMAYVQKNCFSPDYFVKLFVKGLEDESSNCTRQTLIALDNCLRYLLDSESSLSTLVVLEVLPLVAKNPYWLVKVKLIEMLTELPYVSIHHVSGTCNFQNKVIHSVLFDLLQDDDQRVRAACASAFCKIVPNLYFEHYCVEDTTVTAKARHFTKLYLSNLDDVDVDVNTNTRSFIRNLPFPYNEIGNNISEKIEYSLSIILNKLKYSLYAATSRHFLFGCLETLQNLACCYPTTLYSKAWSCFSDIKLPKQHILKRSNSLVSPLGIVPPRDDSISSAADLFSFCISLLESSVIGYDLTCQHNLLKVSGNLFAGIALKVLKPFDINLEAAPKSWEMLSDQTFASHSEILLNHVVKLLNIFHHVVDELPPVLPQSKPVLSNFPGTGTLSPIKRRKSDLDKNSLISPGKLIEKEEKNEKLKDTAKANALGYFSSSAHYMKIYDVLKTAYTNYKVTLDTDASDKFLNLLNATLTTLTQILEIGSVGEIGRYAEEILSYLRCTFSLQPLATIQCVQQLLKSLFGTNLASNISNLAISSQKEQAGDDSNEHGFYNIVYQCPYSDLNKCISLLRNINKIEFDGDNTIMGYLHRKETKKIATFTKAMDKILANYIRMFEPMVIKSLEQYTVTSNVNLQCHVLQLLSQLVQLKVNYCLLDAEQIFIGFVLKQFEFIEKGQMHSPQDIVPKIFHFLVQLSYSKQHSKSIIGIPKIIQLCDGLMASGQSPITHCIPALEPIVEDVFLIRNKSNTPDFQELETTREVLLSMLLRLLEYREVIELVTLVINDSKFCTDNTEKWERWSQQVVEAFLPMMRTNKIRLDDITAFKAVRNLIFVLNPAVFRPINDVLVIIFQELPGDDDPLSLINRWLSKLIISFIIITQVKEDALILKILETQSRFAPGCILNGVRVNTDPLNVSNSVNYLEKIPPEIIFVKYLFRVIDLIAARCVSIAKKEEQDYLVEAFSIFLMYCIHIFESGSHCKMAKTAINLIDGQMDDRISLESTNSSFLQLTNFFPSLVFEWCYFLTLLNYNDRKFWSCTMQLTESYGILDQIKDCGVKPKTHCINLEIVRNLATISFCDFLSDNMGDGEQLSWMLVNNIELLINLQNEPPVYELISAVHRNSSVSALFIQAIATKCMDIQDPSFKSRCLKAIENVHPAQIGTLLNLLLPGFLNTKLISLARMVASLASRKVELLLTMTMDEVVAQLPKEDLVKMMESLVELKLAKKHETLISLLNKLSTYFYDHSPVELDQRRTVNPEYIKKLSINRAWYLSQVKARCRYGCEGMDAAKLLSKLEYEELTGLMSQKDFDKLVLKDCILWGLNQIRIHGLVEEPSLVKAAVHCLLKEVSRTRSLFPKPHQVYRVTGRDPTSSETKYMNKTSEIFSSDAFTDFLYSIIPGVTTYIESIPHFPTIKIPDTSFEDLMKFAVICLECVNYSLSVDSNQLNINFTDCAITCANVILKEVHLNSILALDTHISWLCSAVNSVYKLVEYLLLNEEPLPILPRTQLKNTLDNLETAAAGLACHQLSILVTWLSKVQNVHTDIPRFLFNSIRSIIVSLSRLPLVNSYVLTPPTAWKSGWSPELGGTFGTQVPLLPIDFLQEIDILEQFIFRITLLGWTSRQQFEETWMCLLSVLCYEQSETLMPEEINALAQATSLSIQAITSLLLQTLYYPHPGNPNVSELLRAPRNKDITDTSISIKKLRLVQNKLEYHYKECSKCFGGSKGLLNVFDNTNLENLSNKYSCGYFSTEYLMLLPNTVNGNSVAERVYKQRQKILEDTGLDVNSCLQFLLDLYSRWLTGEETAPLRILHEAVRSLVIISDLFTERSQFSWMLDTCLEISKKHSVEDELVHQYVVLGICKAASVIQPEMETFEIIKRLLSQYLRSAFLPSRIASLYGLLYLIHGCLLTNTVIGGISEELQLILPLAIEYINGHMNSKSSMLKQTREYTLLVWSLAFFLIENIDSAHMESDFPSNVVQNAIGDLAQSTTVMAHNAILKGLERVLIVKKDLWNKFDKVLLNLSLEKLKNPNPKILIAGLQLLLSYMYTDCAEHLENVSKSSDVVQTNPDHLVQTVEKITAIFERLRKGQVFEVDIVCAVLPNILEDFFSPSDVLTKVIGEFLSPQQPHPKLLSRVLFQLFENTIKQSQLSLLQDWVVFSLSNFTQSLSVGMATWYLTCFFISASTNEWLRAYFPYVQSRIGRYEYDDRKMLCIAGVDFYKNLPTDKQKQTFVENFQAVRDQGDILFGDLLESL